MYNLTQANKQQERDWLLPDELDKKTHRSTKELNTKQRLGYKIIADADRPNTNYNCLQTI